MMKRKNQTDPKGNIVPTIYLNFFGYRIWFEAKNWPRFLKNRLFAWKIQRRARNAKNQLLEIQKLVNAINDDYLA